MRRFTSPSGEQGHATYAILNQVKMAYAGVQIKRTLRKVQYSTPTQVCYSVRLNTVFGVARRGFQK